LGVGITAVSYCVPERRLTHMELCDRFGVEAMDRIAHSTGIHERRVVGDDECASDLAARAAEALFSEFGVNREDIDLLIFATQTPDYLLPTTACLLQQRLGLPKTTAAFDINLGCSQYVHSLGVAYAMVSSGLRKKALVLTGDTVSRILHPMDKAVVPLFGDAGTATLVEETGDEHGFRAFDFGTDGAGGPVLIWPTSGLRLRPSSDTALETTDKFGATRTLDHMYMDGSAVFVFTLKTVPVTINRCLAAAQMKIDDVDLFVFHQASKLIVESAAKHFKLPPDRYHMHFGHLGNSGGSTVAICLADAIKKGRVQPGSRLMLSAFGVGLSWASALMTWPTSARGAVSVGE
jgi:3-oxoacyl-[acyl-carrier-protein] synthase-3